MKESGLEITGEEAEKWGREKKQANPEKGFGREWYGAKKSARLGRALFNLVRGFRVWTLGLPQKGSGGPARGNNPFGGRAKISNPLKKRAGLKRGLQGGFRPQGRQKPRGGLCHLKPFGGDPPLGGKPLGCSPPGF